jgi:hypothetical protein
MKSSLSMCWLEFWCLQRKHVVLTQSLDYGWRGRIYILIIMINCFLFISSYWGSIWYRPKFQIMKISVFSTCVLHECIVCSNIYLYRYFNLCMLLEQLTIVVYSRSIHTHCFIVHLCLFAVNIYSYTLL